MAPISRRGLFTSVAAVGAAAQVSAFSVACAPAEENRRPTVSDDPLTQVVTPYDFGAVGDGRHDDTAALRRAYEVALERGGGELSIPGGRIYIPGHLVMESPGVSLVGQGGAAIGGGEVRVGPETYDKHSSGVSFAGDRVSGVSFDRGDDYGKERCLVLRNVRGLDISSNVFASAGKGIAVETSDGNTKVHTTAMLRISANRFTRLAFGIYGDTAEWDRLSDWQITDNYFNYCSDTSVWIASSQSDKTGGVDGLNFSGNTIFSLNHNAFNDPLFASKRYNLRLGRTNWLRIVNNNFFEAGLSAVYLDTPQNFTFVGNHIAWPGQRDLSDGLEIRNGSPIGVIEGNTFASWTRAAVGFYDTDNLSRIEVGQNAWRWNAKPDSWKGEGEILGHRIYASSGGTGFPIVRDFQDSGAYDELKGSSLLQSRDVKSPKGGITGATRRGVSMSEAEGLFRLSDISDAPNFGGLISVTVTNSADDALSATYLLFVSAHGSICKVIESGGYIEEGEIDSPSLEWRLSDGILEAIPVGSIIGNFDFDAVSLGAVSPS